MRTLFCLLLALGADANPSSDVAAEAEVMPAPRPAANMPELWELALANNPALREAEAEIAMARGQLLQAKKYPNPRFMYSEENVGTPAGTAGMLALELTQEIVTGGKRRLDQAIAQRGMDAATLAQVGRRFDVLTRIRRAHYDYLGWHHTVNVYGEVTAGLQEGVDITRKQVAPLGTRSRADLLRLEALQEEMKIGQAQSRLHRDSAWRQLAAEIGLPELPPCELPGGIAVKVTAWSLDTIRERTLASNSELMLAGVGVDRARLEIDRARAEAIPNITLGGGYSHDYAEGHRGGIISVEVPIPVWDRKQGHIAESRARLDRAEAIRQGVGTRLSREIAEAFARYEASRLQADRLDSQVLRRLRETLDLVRKAYQAGAKEVTFADVLLTEQSLNATRLQLAQTNRELWRAYADLQGLMQLDVGDELGEGKCP